MKSDAALALLRAQQLIEDLDHPALGLFELTGPLGRRLRIVASKGCDWDHVSVSLPASRDKTPTWKEMCFVKSLFWDEEEAVMQLHPPQSLYVNYHPGCLHLWKPQHQPLPLPDRVLVGPYPGMTTTEQQLIEESAKPLS